MVPSPPKIRIASASLDNAGTPSIHSVVEAFLNKRRFDGEVLSPKITAARMQAGLRCQVTGLRILAPNSLADTWVCDLTPVTCDPYFGRHFSMKSTRSFFILVCSARSM